MRVTSFAVAFVLAASSVLAQQSGAPASAPANSSASAASGVDIAALTQCGATCTSESAKKAGCKDETDVACWCKSQKFGDAAAACLKKNCEPALALAYPQFQQQCAAAKQDATFTWPVPSTAAAAGGAGGAGASAGTAPQTAGGAPAATNNTASASASTPSTNTPPAAGTDKKNGAMAGATMVWPAFVGAAALSVGMALVA